MRRSEAGAAALMLLAGCAFNAPSGTITGAIDSSKEVGGYACPLLVTGSDGERWEVTLPDGYVMDIEPAGDMPRTGLIGPDGEVIAPMGGTVEITLTDHEPGLSLCRWGTPVLASKITAP